MAALVELVKIAALASLCGLAASVWLSDTGAVGVGVGALYLLAVRISKP